MGFVALKCPSCGADIEIDDSREFGFCSYCGTKIMQDKIVVEHTGSIKIDRSRETNNLLARASDFMRIGNYEDAERYYNRVLDYDCDNEVANSAIQELYKIIKGPNVFISVTTGFAYSKKAQVIVYVDKKKTGKIPAGMQQAFSLPVGEHLLEFRIATTLGKKHEMIMIENRFTRIDLTVKCKFGNMIEII